MIERVNSRFFDMKIREEIEWTNYWIDKGHCRNSKQKRILLIGDSTSREVRSTLSRVTGLPVDFVGSSSHVLDELLLRQIEFFFEMSQFTYEMIHVQLGCHGIESLPEGIDLNAFYDDYKEQYRNLIFYLKTKAKTIVLGSTTQIIIYKDKKNQILNRLYNHLHSAKSEVPDTKYENDIIRRNGIVKNLCEEENIPFDDLYTFMLAEGKDMRHVDHVHYEKKAKALIANQMAKYVR